MYAPFQLYHAHEASDSLLQFQHSFRFCGDGLQLSFGSFVLPIACFGVRYPTYRTYKVVERCAFGVNEGYAFLRSRSQSRLACDWLVSALSVIDRYLLSKSGHVVSFTQSLVHGTLEKRLSRHECTKVTLNIQHARLKNVLHSLLANTLLQSCKLTPDT